MTNAHSDGVTALNPWKTLGSRLVYKNAWITVREDEVIRPDGQPGIYGVVETRLATGVLALSPSMEVCLVGQYRYPMGVYSWEIVEGGSDPGESALQAIQRELREEAGLTADHWEPLGGEIHVSNCHSSERGYVFVATGLHEVGAAPEGTEDITVKWVPFPEAVRMAAAGEIWDSLSVIGILLADRMLRNGKSFV